MRRRSTAFFLGDVSFLADPKFRALERRLPDPDDFNSAVGAFFVALAAARRNGHPDLDVTAETSLDNAGPAYPLPSIPSTEEGVQGGKPDALDAYYRLTTRYPKGAALSWLRQLVDRHGDERGSTALSFAWIDSTELSTLLSRTEALMASADETEAKVRRNEASVRQLAKLREPESALTEEQRAANLARLHDEMAARGLV